MDEKILLAHGSGGKLSQVLIQKKFLPFFNNPIINKMEDAAVFDINGRLAFTTDSYVVNPLFFPGGDIGKLAVCGTINDLSMCGASPLYLSLSLIIEEGLPLVELEKIICSIQRTAKDAGVQIVTGDTKVVNQGNSDKLFINTSGIGLIPPGVDISSSKAQPGDKLILSGTIGDHGIAVMSQREGFKFKIPVRSDCAPLNILVKDMLCATNDIHCMRDPTRGGLATVLNELATQSGVGIAIEENKIPIHKSVEAACELLGFDPLYIANEGKLLVIVPPAHANKILSAMKSNHYGNKSAIIGEVVEEHQGRVTMKTVLGSSRIIDMLTGELLPRIC